MSRGALGEVGVEELRAHRLDHLDRDQLVILALEVAVILQQQRDAPREAALLDARAGVVVLLARDRGRRDAAAVVLGGVHREPAPAGADLEQVVGGLQVELAAGRVELGERGLGQGGFGRLEDAAGIGHRLVEHQLVEPVAEVVVRGDVARAAGA